MRIVATNWTHGGPVVEFVSIERLRPRDPERWGLVIAFNGEIQVRARSPSPPNALIDTDHIFQVLVAHSPANDLLLKCWCPVAKGEILPVQATVSGTRVVAAKELSSDVRNASAIAYVVDKGTKDDLFNRGQLWVKLRGDFVRDVRGRAIDAEFVRGQFGTGDRPAGRDVGIQGGLFESWFGMEPPI